MSLHLQIFTSQTDSTARETVALVNEAVRPIAPEAHIEEVVVTETDEARKLDLPGSPTIHVKGRDLEDRGGAHHWPAYRVYSGAEGPDRVPPRWLIEAAVLRACEPRHVLFLCVANSARSQLAEGIARSLAPQHVTISSAGSSPSQVNPLAVQVLREIGIDISTHFSKSVDDLDARGVDAVITLCAEEVCPTFLGKARKVHWALKDPAYVHDPERKLLAFRQVRDELVKRMRSLFPQSKESANGNADPA